MYLYFIFYIFYILYLLDASEEISYSTKYIFTARKYYCLIRIDI